jgi:hypothetical protein
MELSLRLLPPQSQSSEESQLLNCQLTSHWFHKLHGTIHSHTQVHPTLLIALISLTLIIKVRPLQLTLVHTQSLTQSRSLQTLQTVLNAPSSSSLTKTPPQLPSPTTQVALQEFLKALLHGLLLMSTSKTSSTQMIQFLLEMIWLLDLQVIMAQRLSVETTMLDPLHKSLKYLK